MWRVKLLPAILGFFLLLKGCDERKLSSSSSSDPLERSFAQLEAGEVPDSDYVRLTDGVAIYSLGILHLSKAEMLPGPDASLKWFYYPVLSPEHDDVEGLKEYLEDPGTRKNYRVQGLQVLVKTDQYDTVGDLPVGMEEIAAFEGTVINKISPLGLEESQLLQRSFPRVASGKVLVLELGREPSGFFGYALYFGGGILLFLASGAWIIIGLSRAELPEA